MHMTCSQIHGRVPGMWSCIGCALRIHNNSNVTRGVLSKVSDVIVLHIFLFLLTELMLKS